jgi:20S proteasome alpha/beta subunit
MTVGIAAICRFGEQDAVVVAADRMITQPGLFQIESARTKIIELTQSVVGFYSGPSDGDEVLAETKELLRQPSFSSSTVRGIADLIGRIYASVKQRKLEELILRPLGLDLAGFRELAAHSSYSHILGTVAGQVAQHNLGVEILVTGIDADRTGQLFGIDHPGVLLDKSLLGFWAVGAPINVITSLVLRRYSRQASLLDAIHHVYEAKTFADILPGIGQHTDLAVVVGGRLTFLSTRTITLLSVAHKPQPALNEEEGRVLREAIEADIKEPN